MEGQASFEVSARKAMHTETEAAARLYGSALPRPSSDGRILEACRIDVFSGVVKGIGAWLLAHQWLLEM